MSGEAKQHPLVSRRVYRMTGTESRDLLQRISTADTSPLTQAQPVATLLTNEKGRVVDLACILPEPHGSLLVAGIGDNDGRVARWLERFIIMEDATVDDVSEAYSTAVVYAEGSDGCWELPETIPDSIVPVVMGRHRWGLAILPRNAASLALQVVDSPSFMRDRVAAAVPWPPNEVGERRHPLECRLRSLISFTKGCYIGQEVIARLDAYRKVQMALTRFEGMLDPGESAPVTLQTSGGAEAGVVTSIAIGATRIHSLGFLRLDHLREGRSVNTPQGAILRPVDTDPEEGIYA